MTAVQGDVADVVDIVFANAGLAGDISSPATGAALVESAERHFGGLDKFDSGTRWPSFTTQGGGR